LLQRDPAYGPRYLAQVAPGEICAHKIVLFVRLIHLYHGAADAYAAEQSMDITTNNMQPVFICSPYFTRAGRHSTFVAGVAEMIQ